MRDPDTSMSIVPTVGAGVWTEDKERLGSVGDVVGDYLRVDDGDGRSRWFGLGELQSADDERAILDFSSDDVAARGGDRARRGHPCRDARTGADRRFQARVETVARPLILIVGRWSERINGSSRGVYVRTSVS